MSMKEKLHKFFVMIKNLTTSDFYGTVIIKFEAGNIVHVEEHKSIKID